MYPPQTQFGGARWCICKDIGGGVLHISLQVLVVLSYIYDFVNSGLWDYGKNGSIYLMVQFG